MDIELRVETEEVAAAIRQYLYELEQTTVEQFLNGREEQNEGTDEDSECEGRRENGVGHGSTGDGGQRCVQVRNVTIEWIPARCTIGYWPLWDTETRPFRPERGEDCDDPPNGRWVNLAPGTAEDYIPGPWTGHLTGRFDAFGTGWTDVVRYWPLGDRDGSNKEAYERAEALLLEHLDEGQARDWKNDSSFDVIAQDGGTYKVDAQAQSVTNYANGVWYCLQPYDSMIPSPDVALAQKLWLEADEAGFLKAANCFPLRERRPDRTVGYFYDILTANAPVITHEECDIVFRMDDASCP